MIIRCKNKRILHSLAAVLLCVSLTVCLAACGVKQGKVTRWFKTVVDEDGSPELCTSRYFGSGMIDSRVNVLDFTDGSEYELADRGNTDYELAEKDGKLLVIQRGAMSDRDKILKEGPLQLKDGELKIGN